MHEKNTHWTYSDRKLLHAAWKRREAGESTEDLAKEFDLSAEAIRKQWRALGYDPDAVYRQERTPDYTEHLGKVWRWRQKGATWRECTERLPGVVDRHRLRAAVEAYCEQHELPCRPGPTDSQEDRDAQVYEWRLEGVPFTECATRLGLRPTKKVTVRLCTSLRNYCERHSLEYPYAERSHDEQTAEQIYKWRLEGVSYPACAKRLGRENNRATVSALERLVRKHCKDNGLSYPRPHSTKGRDKKVYVLRCQGKTLDECAEALGLEPSARTRKVLTLGLQRHCKRQGLPLPSTTEPSAPAAHPDVPTADSDTSSHAAK